MFTLRKLALISINAKSKALHISLCIVQNTASLFLSVSFQSNGQIFLHGYDDT